MQILVKNANFLSKNAFTLENRFFQIETYCFN